MNMNKKILLSMICVVHVLDSQKVSAQLPSNTLFVPLSVDVSEIKKKLHSETRKFERQLVQPVNLPKLSFNVFQWTNGCVARLQALDLFDQRELPPAVQRIECTAADALSSITNLVPRVLRNAFLLQPSHQIDNSVSNSHLSFGDKAWGGACLRGDLRGCIHVARAYRDGIGVKKDQAIAALLYQHACRHGGLAACAQQYFHGSGKPENRDRAMKLYRASCTRGEQIGCFLLGLRLTAINKKEEASALFREACANYELGGCRQWTRLVLSQRNADTAGLQKSEQEILLGMSCVGGHRHACIDLGQFYYQNSKSSEDKAKAVEAFKIACAQSLLAKGCSLAGDVLMEQKHGRKDAEPFYVQGCRLNEGYSCMKLSRLEQDPKISKRYRKKACQLGKKTMCK